MFLLHSKKYNILPISDERKKVLKKHIQQYKIPISDLELWDLALTHISYTDTATGSSYERLEFLGDSVLGLCLADILFTDYPELTEGKMSMIKSGLVNEKTLANLGIELDLLNIVKLGNGEKLKDKRAQEKVLCDLIESTLAVIFLQSGFKKSRDFVKRLLESRIFSVLTEGLGDYKTRLQKIAVKVYKAYPYYEIIDTEGPDHGKIFTVTGKIKNFQASGKGRSKKEGEQKVAQMVLDQMREYVVLHPDSLLAQELSDDI